MPTSSPFRQQWGYCCLNHVHMLALLLNAFQLYAYVVLCRLAGICHLSSPSPPPWLVLLWYIWSSLSIRLKLLLRKKTGYMISSSFVHPFQSQLVSVSCCFKKMSEKNGLCGVDESVTVIHVYLNALKTKDGYIVVTQMTSASLHIPINF